MTERQPQSDQTEAARFSRRRFLKCAAWGSVGLALLDVFEVNAQALASFSDSYYPDLRPDGKTVAGAKEVLADYKLKAEEAGKSGNINNLSNSVDSVRVKEAYSVIDQDENPQKYHPQEYAQRKQNNDRNLRDTLKMVGLTFIQMALSGILIERTIGSKKKNSGGASFQTGRRGRIVTA